MPPEADPGSPDLEDTLAVPPRIGPDAPSGKVHSVHSALTASNVLWPLD
jgi:hypothetical protein